MIHASLSSCLAFALATSTPASARQPPGDPVTIVRSLTAHAGAVADGSLMIVGGIWGPDHFNLLTPLRWREPGEWSAAAALPGPRDFPGVAALDGRFYVLGGTSREQVCIPTVISLDLRRAFEPPPDQLPGHSPWLARAPMPTPRNRLACTVAAGRLYAIGGMDARGNSNACEAYDPRTDTWTTLAPMPTPRHGFAALTVGDTIMALGGEAGQAFEHTGVVEVLNTAAGTWESWPPMPGPRLFFGAVELDGTVYVFGGRTVGPTPSLKLDTRTRVWSSSDWPPPMERDRFACGVLARPDGGRELVIVGGEGSDGGPMQEGVVRLPVPSR